MPAFTKPEHKLSSSQYARTKLAKFAAQLLEWRIGSKLTRAELAAKAGCSGQQISNIEKKKCFPSFPVYAALCREMGVEPVADFPVEV